MKFDTKFALIVFGTFFGLVILSVTLIVELSRTESKVIVTTTIVKPTPVTPSAPTTRSILLKNANGHCYEFSNLEPQLETRTCTGGTSWTFQSFERDGKQQNTLVFDTPSYETCIQPPGSGGGTVLGTTGSGCSPIMLEPTTNFVKAPDVDLCITISGTSLVWGSCTLAYSFFVVDL
jgi:hypothetical protein